VYLVYYIRYMGLLKMSMITRVRLWDHVKIPDLLDLAGIPSAKRMVVKAVSMEAWTCKSSSDGKDSVRNYVGTILFDNNKTDTDKKTRSAKTVEIGVPLRGDDTFVAHAATMWNKSDMLRRALAKTDALNLGQPLPAVKDVDLHLRDLACLLRLVGCLLRDVGRLHRLVGQVLQEVGRLLTFLLSQAKEGNIFCKKHFSRNILRRCQNHFFANKAIIVLGKIIVFRE
jgi:hypothetical protein